LTFSCITDDIIVTICLNFLRADEISSLACTCKRFSGLFNTQFWRTFCEVVSPPNFLNKILLLYDHVSICWTWYLLGRILTICPNEAVATHVFGRTNYSTPACPRLRNFNLIESQTESHNGLRYAFVSSKCVHEDEQASYFGGQFLKKDIFM
jgi:hypothetical protein